MGVYYIPILYVQYIQYTTYEHCITAETQVVVLQRERVGLK